MTEILVWAFFVLAALALAWLKIRGLLDAPRYPSRWIEREQGRNALLAYNALADAVHLALDEKCAAAHELATSIDRTRLGPVDLELLDALQSWVYANLGRDEEAIICAHAAMKAADALTLTLAGATLARLDSFAEAFPLLRHATANAELEAAARALALFHLGLAERGQGRFDEARQAWERIRTELPDSPYAARAIEELETLTVASPYR